MSEESNCVRCNKHPKKAGESVCKVCYDSGSGYFDMVGNDLADYFEWPEDEKFGAEDVIEEALLSLDGENITVLVNSFVFQNGTSRGGLYPQLSINGRLGINTIGEITQYSIVNSEKNYVYFHARDVWRMLPPSSLTTSPAVSMRLYVRIDTPQEDAEEFGAETFDADDRWMATFYDTPLTLNELEKILKDAGIQVRGLIMPTPILSKSGKGYQFIFDYKQIELIYGNLVPLGTLKTTELNYDAEEFGAENESYVCLENGKTYRLKKRMASHRLMGWMDESPPLPAGKGCFNCGSKKCIGLEELPYETFFWPKRKSGGLYGAESDYTLKDWWQQSMDNCICGGNGCLYCEEINKDYDENIALSDLRKISKIVGTDCHCDKTYEDDVLQCYNCQTAMTLERFGAEAETFEATKGMDTYAQPFSELKIKPTKTKVGILIATIVAGGFWYSKKMKE